MCSVMCLQYLCGVRPVGPTGETCADLKVHYEGDHTMLLRLKILYILKLPYS